MPVLVVVVRRSRSPSCACCMLTYRREARERDDWSSTAEEGEGEKDGCQLHGDKRMAAWNGGAYKHACVPRMCHMSMLCSVVVVDVTSSCACAASSTFVAACRVVAMTVCACVSPPPAPPSMRPLRSAPFVLFVSFPPFYPASSPPPPPQASLSLSIDARHPAPTRPHAQAARSTCTWMLR